MSPSASPVKAPKALLRAQWLANLTDTSIRIPGIGIRFGLDFIVGLIPGIGDAIMLLVSGSIILSGWRLGMPRALLVRMLRNAVIDFLLGLVPVIGDLVDLFYKANQANVRIMEKWWVSTHHGEIQSSTREILEKWDKQQSSEQ